MSTLMQYRYEPIPDHSSPIPDLDAFSERNEARQKIKDSLPPGKWYVKRNVFRDKGTQYEVRRQLADQESQDDPTIIPCGYDQAIREAIAAIRNDNPEEDISVLIETVRQLESFEATRRKLIERIIVLEKENQTLRCDLHTVEEEYKLCCGEYGDYIQATESLHVNAAVLRDALAFYAKEASWEWSLLHHPIIQDNGQCAREALTQSESGKQVLDRLHQLEAFAQSVGTLLTSFDQAGATESLFLQDHLNTLYQQLSASLKRPEVP